jgi:hypothetical protein
MKIYFIDSIETSFFSPPFNSLLEKIGKSALQQQANTSVGSPNSSGSSSIFTNHQPLSFEMISSFTLHVRMHTANYLTCMLIQKPQLFKALTFNIPAAIVETFARLITYDPDNFIKYFTRKRNLFLFFLICIRKFAIIEFIFRTIMASSNQYATFSIASTISTLTAAIKFNSKCYSINFFTATA